MMTRHLQEKKCKGASPTPFGRLTTSTRQLEHQLVIEGWAFFYLDLPYREVRSLRLTDDTWKRLGIVSECLGLTRADYLEEIIKKQSYTCKTRQNQGDIQLLTSAELETLPSMTR